MFKKTSSRNQRSKDIRIKHVLQICLLLGVCFWLIYQVKHSHDKRKEFNEKDAKVSVKELTDAFIIKFGRKDLPHVQEVSKNYKHEEDESVMEDETKHDEQQEEKPKRLEEEEHEGASKHEEEQQEEGSKHEEEDEEPEEIQGEEGSKHDDEEQEAEVKDEEAEDEGKGDGDDEVDENEQEIADAEVGNEEELMNEEKEREAEGDKENDEKEGQEESEHSANDQNLDGGEREAHGAREEHYKADDASSAVSHNMQSISTEADKLETENFCENITRNVLEQESEANATEKTDGDESKSASKVDEGKHSEGSSSNNDENKSELEVDEGKHSDSDNSLNVTYTKENERETVSANSEHIFLPNTTDSVEQASNNFTGVSKETGNTDAKVNTEMPGSLQNGTSAQYTTEDGMVTEEKYKERANEMTSNGQQSDSNAIDESKIEMVDSTTTESSNSLTNTESGMSENTPRINATAEGHSSESYTTKEKTDSTQYEKQGGDDESRGTDESSDTCTSNETVDGGHIDPIDSSDNTLSQEEKDAAVDLSTLPDITTERSNNEDTVAE